MTISNGMDGSFFIIPNVRMGTTGTIKFSIKINDGSTKDFEIEVYTEPN